MPDPHIIAGALTGAALSAPLVFFGAQVDALAVGLMSAVFVSIWLETIDNKGKAACSVMFASLLAGYGSPVAAGWVSAQLPSIAGNADSLRMLLALAIGAAGPTSVPIALRWIGKKGDSL